jgi:Ca2+-transporting ATPase
VQLTQLPVQGLTDEAVIKARVQHGPNVLTTDSGAGLFITMKEVVTEPMFLLLLVACAVYFALDRIEEALTLIVALVLVAGISVNQLIRSDRALSTLRELTQPKAQVRRL